MFILKIPACLRVKCSAPRAMTRDSPAAPWPPLTSVKWEKGWTAEAMSWGLVLWSNEVKWRGLACARDTSKPCAKFCVIHLFAFLYSGLPDCTSPTPHKPRPTTGDGIIQRESKEGKLWEEASGLSPFRLWPLLQGFGLGAVQPNSEELFLDSYYFIYWWLTSEQTGFFSIRCRTYSGNPKRYNGTGLEPQITTSPWAPLSGRKQSLHPLGAPCLYLSETHPCP